MTNRCEMKDLPCCALHTEIPKKKKKIYKKGKCDRDRCLTGHSVGISCQAQAPKIGLAFIIYYKSIVTCLFGLFQETSWLFKNCLFFTVELFTGVYIVYIELSAYAPCGAKDRLLKARLDGSVLVESM